MVQGLKEKNHGYFQGILIGSEPRGGLPRTSFKTYENPLEISMFVFLKDFPSVFRWG